ncbi:MAG: pyruvate kinase [Candidatus Aenigmarchaeota archaeon]|nr:pyruvate kinase [Candidatus Aenigmarchaeota archaeon]
MIRKTKVIATLGPASKRTSMIKRLVDEGVAIFRLNLAHGNRKSHEEMVNLIKRLDLPVKLMADIPGPKIRIGQLPATGIDLITGSEVYMEFGKNAYEDNVIPIPYSSKISAKVGDEIFLDDGAIALEAKKIAKDKILCEVLHGGLLLSRKGVNISSFTPEMPFSIMDKGKIIFAKELGVDFIALSFVNDASNVEYVRSIVKAPKIKLISKIETVNSLKNIDKIIEVSDGIMIARGDLGLQVPIEELPLHQKNIIKKCHKANKPVIVATHILLSMVRSPFPSRAEVLDIANSVFDGVDAIMLSNETAAGAYPIEAVRMAVKVIEATEKSGYRNQI